MEKRVLLGRFITAVEDDQETLSALQQFGEMYLDGVPVDTVGVFDRKSLDSAFNRIRETQPDVVTVDLKLGSASGFDLLDRLNDDPRTSRIWKIAVTGEVGPTKRRQILRVHHADDVVEKPFDNEDLRQAIMHGFSRVEQLYSDPHTGIPGSTRTEIVLERRVFNLKDPWVVFSTDWNGYGGFLEIAGPDVAEQTLREVLYQWRNILNESEKPQFRFIGQLGKSDGAIVVCRAENASSIGHQLVASFHEIVLKRYLDIKGGEKIAKRGFAIRQVVERGRNNDEVKVDHKVPNLTLSIGINSNRWFQGNLSFAAENPWTAEASLIAPRLMFYPRMVRRLADKARVQAEELAKNSQPFPKSWVVINNDHPWNELSDQEKSVWRQTHPREKVRGGKVVLVHDEAAS